MSKSTDSEQHTTPTDLDAVLEGADMNALRLALYQVTGDPDLRAMQVEHIPLRGGAYSGTALKADHFAAVKAKAKAYLLAHDGEQWPKPPDLSTTQDLVEVFLDQEWPANRVLLAYDELAFDDFSREVHWTAGVPREKLADFKVLVVGAGISGLAAAIQLIRLEIPFTVVDRLDNVGGTWHLNRYPEVRVDVPSTLFQYTFTKRYPWPSVFATGKQMMDYFEWLVDEYELWPHLEMNTSVEAAVWKDESSRWEVSLTGPEGKSTLQANVVISAAGLFSTPNAAPDIEGFDEYRGAIFHTAKWDATYDYAGKRVALIGNGSSGAQLMPAIARHAESLTVYQRNPQWVGPMANLRSEVDPQHHWLCDHIPFYWNWTRFSGIAPLQTYQELHLIDEGWQQEGGSVNERNDKFRKILTDYISEQVDHDPELLAKVLPTYPPLVRRLVADNGWFKALLQDNVELVTDRIDRFTEDGITTVDGTTRSFDLIILALGFQVSKFLWPVDYVGRDKATLESLWSADGARAYLSMVMPGFPNLFTFYGPNSQPRGGAALHSTAEVWTRYALKMIITMVERDIHSFEVRREVFDEYNQGLDTAMKKLIWEMEGRSYYVNEHGRVVTNIPWDAEDYFEMLREPDLTDFRLE